MQFLTSTHVHNFTETASNSSTLCLDFVLVIREKVFIFKIPQWRVRIHSWMQFMESIFFIFYLFCINVANIGIKYFSHLKVHFHVLDMLHTICLSPLKTSWKILSCLRSKIVRFVFVLQAKRKILSNPL